MHPPPPDPLEAPPRRSFRKTVSIYLTFEAVFCQI